jgi:hypothetical protein
MGIRTKIFGNSRDRFGRFVLRQARLGGAQAQYDAESFAVRVRRDSTAQWSGLLLGTLFREVSLLNRAERAELVRQRLRAALYLPTLPQTWAAAQPLLRIVLRGTGNVSGLDLDNLPLRRPSALPYLDEMAVIDLPDAIAYATTKLVTSWGVTHDQVFAAAMSNVAASADVPPPPPGGPVVLTFVDDTNNYLASRLLVPHWLASLAEHVGGRPVAFAPSNGTVIVCADHPEHLPELHDMVRAQFRDDPRSLSPQAYTVDALGALTAYRAAAPGRLADVIHHAQLLLAVNSYDAQTSALQELHSREGLDLHVAALITAQRSDGSVFSAASWAEAMPSLLPKADYIAFTGRGETFFVPWSTVARQTDLMPTPGHRPQRFLVESWPADEIIDDLRKAAVAP